MASAALSSSPRALSSASVARHRGIDEHGYVAVHVAGEFERGGDAAVAIGLAVGVHEYRAHGISPVDGS
jgi:hypothetical protein